MKKILKDYKEKFDNNLNAENNLNRIKASLSFAPDNEFKPKRRAPLYIGLAVAFAVMIVIITVTTIMLIPTGGKVIYKGMDIVENNVMSLDIDDEIDKDIPDVIVDDKISYYANKNTEIVIRIKLVNPESFEILSFTLNGYKYQTFEFLEGSNSTNIYVKFKTGNQSGLEEVTIDAMKYIDGDKIESCKYEADKTIKLGITYDNVPVATIKNKSIGATSYSAQFDISDIDNLINQNKIFKYYLFSNDALIKKGNVEMPFTFNIDTLLMDTSYSFVLSSVIDLYDGRGLRSVYLYKEDFKTLPGITLDKVDSTVGSLDFKLNLVDGVTIKSTKLYLADALVKENNDNTLLFDNLLSNNEYRLEVLYKYKSNGIDTEATISFTGKTKKKDEPKLTVISAIVLDKKIYVEAEMQNEASVKSVKCKVYLDGVLFTELDGFNTDTFINVGDSEFIECKLVYSIEFDLNDGSGINTKEVTHITNK